MDGVTISIHALREEGDLFTAFPASKESISIHALREEGDRRNPTVTVPREKFLSTPSARRATSTGNPNGTMESISIHALREEGDRFYSRLSS